VLIKNPVYKGEFIAHRWIDVKTQKPTKDGLSTRTVTHRQERPEDEWIRVQVPAIVDAGLWQAANDMLAKNKLMARRNAGESYLLTGLVKCATCERTIIGITRHTRKGKSCDYRAYRCPNTFVHPRYIRETVGCRQSAIQTDVLDMAVWEIVCNALLEPQVLLSALESDMLGEQNAQLERQIAYLEHEIEEKQTEDDKLYKAYMAGVFDEHEYAARRTLLKDERARLQVELDRLHPLRATREQFEAQKALILDFAERVRSLNAHADPPFEIKQRIIKMTVNRIVLDTHAKTFRLEGAMRGLYPIVNIPAGRA
jgi:site-specific DNA recombinase